MRINNSSPDPRGSLSCVKFSYSSCLVSVVLVPKQSIQPWQLFMMMATLSLDLIRRVAQPVLFPDWAYQQNVKVSVKGVCSKIIPMPNTCAYWGNMRKEYSPSPPLSLSVSLSLSLSLFLSLLCLCSTVSLGTSICGVNRGKVSEVRWSCCFNPEYKECVDWWCYHTDDG